MLPPPRSEPGDDEYIKNVGEREEEKLRRDRTDKAAAEKAAAEKAAAEEAAARKIAAEKTAADRERVLANLSEDELQRVITAAVNAETAKRVLGKSASEPTTTNLPQAKRAMRVPCQPNLNHSNEGQDTISTSSGTSRWCPHSPCASRRH